MSTQKLYPVALVLPLLMAACLDDPLAVTEDGLPALDEHPEMATSHDAAQDGVIVEPFRQRLAVDLSVNGELIPFGTITLRIEGIATKRLTGGDVRVLLPTMAAMEHAGPGKRPSYPIGRPFPTVASWVLPAMDASETWQQSVEITLPEQGHYHVVVAVNTTASQDEISPYVFDDTSNEVWLLVMDGGGFSKRFFDDSVIPEGFAPGEGPFRDIPDPGPAAAATSEETGADGNGDIPIHLVYYDAGVRRNAERAKLTINYRDRDHDIVRTVYRTVPAGGIVRVSCPRIGEYIQGSGLVPTTAEVYAQKNIVNFYLGRDDCGETQQISARHSVYIPWRNLDSVIPLIESHFDQHRERIAFEVDFSTATARYYGSSDRISFGSGDYYKIWVAAHEFGHGFHHKALGGLWATQNCSSHDIDQGSSYTCAFSEGFADYAANVGRGDPEHWEYKHYTDSGYDDAEIEGNIAALLHDLIDSNADSSDRTSYPADYIADVFETCRAGGSKRNDVTDFVWCLENRVNEDVHDTGFPRGPDAPSSARESATEPDTWNVAHIRAVWWKNVT